LHLMLISVIGAKCGLQQRDVTIDFHGVGPRSTGFARELFN
jgi:hypothetical protein